MKSPVSFGFSSHARVLSLAAQPATHRAFTWLHLHELRLRQWQRELVAIAAPPFGEGERAAWFTDRFRELGLFAVQIDDAGNALGWLRPPEPGEPLVLLSAHLDTVFPAGTPLDLVEEEAILRGPGAADNGAGLTGLLALIAAMRHARIETATNIVFAANTGEEAEGDLRGMRHLFAPGGLGDGIVASIALEGAGTEVVVSRGLGSRRFHVQMSGPGGHAWTDAGTPNPIAAMATAIAALARLALTARPRTVLNFGRIEGGTSLTSIPQAASALIDLRSVDAQELLVREVHIYRAVEDAVLAENAQATKGSLRFRIDLVGDRPAGELPPHAPILHTVRAVDRHLRLRTEERIGSTDANIPIALGRNGIAMGCGGVAGGIHTTAEWYDSTGREWALRRVLLVLLDLCGREFLTAAGWIDETSRIAGKVSLPG